MNPVALATLPAVVINECAMARHEGSLGGATPPCEIWAVAPALPSTLRLTKDDIAVDGTPLDGAAAFAFMIAGAALTVRVWLAGTPAAMFVAANVGEAPIPTPVGLVPAARATSQLLILRAFLLDARGWLMRMREFQRLRANVRDADATPAEIAAFTALRGEVEARTPPVHRKPMGISNEAFFGAYKHVDIRLYEHDDLHRTTCYYDEPLYLSAKDDKALAIIPRRSFDRMSHQDRSRLVREECHAIALERLVIPAHALDVACDPADAYLYALHRICTDLATGWFRDFAIDNFDELWRPDTDFAGRFAAAVASGDVRPRNNGAISDAQRQMLQVHLMEMDERLRLAGLPGPRRGTFAGEALASRGSQGINPPG